MDNKNCSQISKNLECQAKNIGLVFPVVTGILWKVYVEVSNKDENLMSVPPWLLAFIIQIKHGVAVRVRLFA